LSEEQQGYQTNRREKYERKTGEGEEEADLGEGGGGGKCVHKRVDGDSIWGILFGEPKGKAGRVMGRIQTTGSGCLRVGGQGRETRGREALPGERK